jgi:hypothetical protein
LNFFRLDIRLIGNKPLDGGNMTDAKTNHNHKDSVFSLLFSEPPAALELYNAVTGQNYPPDTKLEIVTLSNALFKGQLNDVAFVVDDRLVVLIEHQSTINNNIPLRMLMYLVAKCTCQNPDSQDSRIFPISYLFSKYASRVA